MNSSTARILRKNPTETERTLWRHLRFRQFDGFKFRRQHPIGKYIVDFVCLEKKLIVGVDGSQHVDSTEDVQRADFLRNRGFQIIRFWNNQVFSDIDSVKNVIWGKLVQEGAPHLNPPPKGGRRFIGKEKDK